MTWKNRLFFLLFEMLALKVCFFDWKAKFSENNFGFKIEFSVEFEELQQRFVEVHPRTQQIFKAAMLLIELNVPSCSHKN